MWTEVTFVAQCDHIHSEAVHAGKHRRVSRRRRDMRTEMVFKHRALFHKLVDVRRGQPRVTVQAHVIRAQTINAK